MAAPVLPRRRREIQKPKKHSLRSALTLGARFSFSVSSSEIPDCFLYRYLGAAHEAMTAITRDLPRVKAIYTHAWEGGNPDHDAAHVLGLGLGRSLGIEQFVFQVPFYRAALRGPFPFRVFAPLSANGEVRRLQASRLARLRTVALIRFFPSQVEAFVRLGPFMLIDALWRSGVPVQQSSVARIRQRPTQEPLRYERHGHERFDRMAPYFEAYARSTLDCARLAVSTESGIARGVRS